MDLARIRQWCDEDNWHIEGFRNVDIIAENGRELALCASPSIARRLREGRQYVKELLAALDAFDALVKAAAEWADIYDRWHALTGRDSYAVVSGLRDVLEKKERQLRGAYTALAALDGEPK